MRLGDEKIESAESLKICGYHFGTKPDVTDQIKSVEKKFNERAWLLRNLKRSGFKQEDLKAAYTSMILSVFDFTSVVYHSLLNAEQKLKLERLQGRALAIITGTCRSYSGNVENLMLTTCLLYTSPSPRDS